MDSGQRDEDNKNRRDPFDTGGDVTARARAIDPAVLKLDYVFSALAHPRRRYLVYTLAADDEWTLTELATKLVAWEADIDEAAVSQQARDRMYISLYHVHVPKLVDEGVITFDRDTETIARSTHAEQVLAALAGAGGSLDTAQEAHATQSYDDGSDE
jgi:predicted transcriptional regulator